MTKYFAGNSLAAFSRIDTACVDDTTAGRFNSTYVNSCIRVNINGTNGDAASYIQTPEFTPATGIFWFRFDMYANDNLVGNPYRWIQFNNGTTPVFRIRGDGTSPYLRSEYWNGSAWTANGTFTTRWSSGTLHTLALKLTIGSAWELYLNGFLIGSGSGTWTGAASQITNVVISYPNSVAYISQVMAADYDLRDSHLMTAALSGNSATNTDGTGAYTDLGQPRDETTGVVLTAAGNQRGQTKSAITVPASYEIGAMVLNARARVSGGTITNGKLGVKISGGSESSGSNLNPAGSFGPISRIIETNPDTAAKFTQTEFNNAEIYEEAV